MTVINIEISYLAYLANQYLMLVEHQCDLLVRGIFSILRVLCYGICGRTSINCYYDKLKVDKY